MTVTPNLPTKETKKAYFYEYTGDDNVNLKELSLTKKKPLNVTLNNTDNVGHNFYSSYNYAETITVTGGHYTLNLSGGNSNKTVKLGETKDNTVNISNIGKNKITAGDNGNDFTTSNPYSNNTITAGTGKDNYTLKSGITKITDKGGKNEYTITGGFNTITDKGSDGSTFKFTTVGTSDGGTTKIKAGNGVDTLKIYNDAAPNSGELIINADLGKGDNNILVDYQDSPGDKFDASVMNVKTGNGIDTITLKAGKKNIVDTGKGNDVVKIYGGMNNIINTGDDVDTITVDATTLDTTTSTIKAGKGNDTIEINRGINTIYGETGNDIININGGKNTVYGGGDTITVDVEGYLDLTKIYASADTINLSDGQEEIYTIKGGNTINVSTPDWTSNHRIYLQKGNNTVSLKDGTNEHKTSAIITISAGKNTINAEGYSSLSVLKESGKVYKTAQTLNLSGHTLINAVFLGDGADTIKDSSDSTATVGGIRAGKGNDKFYISNGSNKQLWGEAGNDYFEITSGTSHQVVAGAGNDTVKVIGGDSHQIDANDGNDTIIVSGGSGHVINGYGGKDTFTISTGDSCKLYGGDDNDTFNITGGTSTELYGEAGNDIYNLNMQTGSVTITENDGKNTINVAKGYKGVASVYKYVETNATYNVKFDKSYKLTSSANVVDDVITTTDSNITLYRNFLKDEGFAPGASYRFITNVQDEISDKSIDDRYVNVAANAFTSANVGGKNYTLNFDKLQEDLVAWFSTRDYADSNAVFTGGDANDINSLMAVYTKDTAECFIKA